jgi:hypothetical protein
VIRWFAEHVHSVGVQLRGQSAVLLTRPEVLINSLSVGVAIGVTGYLAHGLAAGMAIGVLAFLVSFAVFRFASGSD